MSKKIKYEIENKNSSGRKLWSVLFNVVFVTTIIVCLASVLLNVVFMPRMVIGESMQPTLNLQGATKSDIVYVNPFAKIKHFDIVVLHREAMFAEDVVKRVIAMEGDKVRIGDKGTGTYVVYLNNQPLNEKYIASNTMKHTYEKWIIYIASLPSGTLDSQGNLTIEENQIFILGDNRSGSSDSSNYGAVDKSQVLGKVFMVVPYNKTIFHARFI